MKKFISNILLFVTVLTLSPLLSTAQTMHPTTYCNPLNIDYTYMIYNSARNVSYRSGADPAVVEFRGEYYMFVTRSHGYWHSRDLLTWDFVKPGRNWYPQGCNAPAAHNYRDSLLYVCGDPSGSMSVLYTDDPKSGDWEATPAILHDLQDPDLFIDDDGAAYMYWGSSNVFPIRGMRLNREDRFLKVGDTVELFNTDMARHGWERFGDNHSNTSIDGFIEGPWMTKHEGRYYLQYAAPGTEFNVYGDGVYVGDNPLGPFTYQAHNPVCYKPGGYMNGAGHGSTVIGPGGQYWHFGSMAFPLNQNWERRLCMYPTNFDSDGIMHCDTRFGDYPHYAPDHAGQHGEFRGWMLLSYGCPTTASGAQLDLHTESGYSGPASYLTDEDCHTFWVAPENDDRQWVTIDLGAASEVRAVQINYNDYKSMMFGRYDGLCHRYVVESSLDGQSWHVMIDKSSSYRDTPNDYVELDTPCETRYVRFRNVSTPTPYLSLSAIRVFGHGHGAAPKAVEGLKVERQADRRDAQVSWKAVKGAKGYNILWGIAPDKLYSSWMVYGNDCSLFLKSLCTDTPYYFAIEAFNENGVSPLSRPQLVK